MKVIYRVCGNLEKYQVKKLAEFNLHFKLGEVDCNEIEEEKFLEVKNYLKDWGLNPSRHVVFEKKEVLDSTYSIVTGYSPSGGYPMPDNLLYQPLTYDISKWCTTCGCGLVQNSEFRLKKVPTIKKKIFGIQWAYDVLFVEKNYYNEIFKPLGVGCKNVRLFKSDSIIDGIVQLDIPTITESLDLHDYQYKVCPICNRRKYFPSPIGFFPVPSNSILPIYLSFEYFGFGASADKKIFVSKELRDVLIKDKNIVWEWFSPCE
jgi:hypothetical protein